MVDAALDLIDGQYVDLVVEAIGDEAAGVEFFGTTSSGTREYHSIKRQQAEGNWTINRLTQGKPPSGRSILGRPRTEGPRRRSGSLQFWNQRF